MGVCPHLNTCWQIKKSAKALSYFMNGFLLWIKSKWDKEQVNKEDVHVTALLKEVAVYHEESGNKGTNTIIIIADESLIAKTSKRYLEIIISNIVDNACKYTRNGTITLSAYAEENKIIISCRDTGRGMSAEKIDSLLFQSKLDEKEQPEAYEFDSFKLGYRFINDMVKLIGAGVSITSTINQGTEVKIILTGLS